MVNLIQDAAGRSYESAVPTYTREQNSNLRIERQRELFHRLTSSLESLHDVRIDELEKSHRRPSQEGDNV